MKKTLLLTLVLCAAPLFGAYDAFLKLDGIKGESQDARHKDWIELASFSWGAGRALQVHQAGQVHVTLHDANVVPDLARALAAGKVWPTVEIEVAGQSYTLENVMISSFTGPSAHGAGNGQPTESLTLNFTKVEYKYTPQDKAGAPPPRGVAPPPITSASMLNPNTVNAPNAEIISDGTVGARFNLLSLQVQGNSAILKVRESAPSYFQGAAASKKKSSSTSIGVKFMVFTFKQCIIERVAPAPDGTETVVLNFSRYDGPPGGFRQ